MATLDGASDTRYVVAKNRKTKTFLEWWGVKMGLAESDFKGNRYTEAGNRYEHPILKAVSEEIVLDRQLIIEKLKLRVNYDGDLNGTIYEVKTHRSDRDFEISDSYWKQAQVEMFAYKKLQTKLQLPTFKKLYIVSYALYPDEYNKDLPVEVDSKRIKFHPVGYDGSFIGETFLPNVKELARCLKKGRFPE